MILIEMDQLAVVAVAYATNQMDCHACLVAATMDDVSLVVRFVDLFVILNLNSIVSSSQCSFPTMNWNSLNISLFLCLIVVAFVAEHRPNFYSIQRKF